MGTMVRKMTKLVWKRPHTGLTADFVCLLLLCLLTGVSVAETKVIPRIEIGEIYTDNVGLDSAESDSFITEVSPGLRATLKGGRVSGSLDYQLQSLFYTNDRQDDEIFHQLESRGTAELLRNIFFVDADASIFQSIIDPDQTVTFDNLNASANRTDVVTASISPYLRQRFAGSVEAEARYRYGIVNYDSSDDDLEDAKVHEALLSVGNLKETSRIWTWLTGASHRRIDFDNDEEDEFQSVIARLGYRPAPKIQLIADLGVDDNDFQTENQADTSGTFWNLGAIWDPSTRNHVEAGFGGRYNGDIYNFLWAHRARHITLDVSYEQGLDTEAGVIIEEGGSIDTSVPGLFGSDADVFERKTATADVSVNWSKSTLTIGLRHEEREIQAAGESNEKIKSISAGYEWRFGPRTTVDIELLALRQDIGNSGNEDIYRAGAGLDRQLGPRTTAGLGFVHTRQDSEDDADDYTENRASIFILREF